MKYIKVHYLDFFDKIGKQISNHYSYYKFKNYNLLQFGRSLKSLENGIDNGAVWSLTESSYILLFKFDFTKGNLPEGLNKLEYLKLESGEFFTHIASAFQTNDLIFNNIYAMEDRSAKTEYYTLEFKDLRI